MVSVVEAGARDIPVPARQPVTRWLRETSSGLVVLAAGTLTGWITHQAILAALHPVPVD